MKREKVEISANILKALFQNVFFINGTAYAGKSTMIKLLAQKYDGICCGENYHDQLMELIDGVHQPNLWYIKNCQDWQQFISRTPQEYASWIEGCSREAEELEMVLLIRYAGLGRMVFADTNLCPETLSRISDYHHVLFLLSDGETAFLKGKTGRSSFSIRFYSRVKRRKRPLKITGRVCGHATAKRTGACLWKGAFDVSGEMKTGASRIHWSWWSGTSA